MLAFQHAPEATAKQLPLAAPPICNNHVCIAAKLQLTVSMPNQPTSALMIAVLHALLFTPLCKQS